MHLRSVFFPFLLLVGLLAGTVPAGAAGRYRLVKVADEFGPLKQPGIPVIASNGTVYFSARTAAGVTGIYKWNGSGSPVLVRAANGNPFRGLTTPTVNAFGVILSRGDLDNAQPIEGIFNIGAAGTNKVIPTAAMDVLIDSETADAAMNASGTMALHGRNAAGWDGIFTIASGGASGTAIATRQPPSAFEDFNDEVSIANDGTVFFIGQTTGGVRNIFKGPTSIVNNGVNSQFSILTTPRCNGVGTMVFTARLKSGSGFGVYLYSGSGYTPFVEPSVDATGFSLAGGACINSSGKIVFSGSPNASPDGVFDGPHAVDNKVVAGGDMIDGRSISNIDTRDNCLDDRGAVVFLYEAGGKYGVGIAIPDTSNQPPPEPVGEVDVAVSTKAGVPGAGGVGSPWPAGATWQSFGEPTIDDSGNVAFLGHISLPRGKTGPRTGIFRQSIGDPTLVATVGDDSPISGMEFFSFLDPLLASDGGLLFQATLRLAGKPSGTLKALFYQPSAGAPIQLVTQSGADVDGTGGAKLLSWKGLALGPGGKVGLLGKLKTGKTPKINGANDDLAAVWSPGGNPAAVLLEGQDLADSRVKSFRLFVAGAGSTGQDRGWFGTWAGESGGRIMAAVTLLNKQVLLGTVGTAANPWQVLAGTGAMGPGLPASSNFSTLFLPNFTPAAKGVVFRAKLADKSTGLFHRELATSSAALVAQPGSPIAGMADATVASLGDPASSPDGSEILWAGQIAVPNGRATRKINALQEFSLGTLRILAAVGQPAPGTEVNAHWKSFQQFAMVPGNPGGGAVLLATLAGPKSTANQGLWLSDASGTLQLLVREGQTMGDSTLKSFTALRAVTGQMGVGRSLNSHGQIVLKLTTADGIQHLAVTSPPAP